jgi:hypothetical protein
MKGEDDMAKPKRKKPKIVDVEFVKKETPSQSEEKGESQKGENEMTNEEMKQFSEVIAKTVREEVERQINAAQENAVKQEVTNKEETKQVFEPVKVEEQSWLEKQVEKHPMRMLGLSFVLGGVTVYAGGKAIEALSTDGTNEVVYEPVNTVNQQ